MAEQLTKPRLTYFSSRGKAEIIRILLAEVGVDYEAVYVGGYNQADQPQGFKDILAKNILPFDALPLWEEPDGFKLCQSMSIARYLAKKHKLFGTNLQEEALIDMIIEGILDISQALLPYRIKFSSATSVEEKLNLKKEMKEEKISVWFARYERMLKKNGEGLGFFVGDSFTFADIGVWLYLEFAEDIELLDLTNLPLLAKFKERMEARPNIDLYRKSQRFPIQNPFKIEA
eukprot:TRINITY_DN6427_c0_g1_i4.p1 TRINITY_DN6427_c0_g1~~TRINITY_DN6427_c0_g1_i4.p1  ORF type:complete len:231 (+),score=54.37 TRINITY_DN6427_c0_g1_i4:69-761(+)